MALPGESELEHLTIVHDWRASSVGPPETWPENLRTALQICLTSRFPMSVWWGPELTLFYNDAYISFLGPKHPAALGRAGREVWAELWHQIGPMIEGVRGSAVASWSEDIQMFFTRALPAEEVYATFSFSPVLGPTGVDGLFCACTETTEKIVRNRRLDTLRTLAVICPHTIEEGAHAALAALAANPADVPFAAVYLVEDGRVRHVRSTGVAEGVLPASVDRDDAWGLVRCLRTRQVVEIDVAGIVAGPWHDPITRALVLPLRVRDAVAGILVAGASARRPLDAETHAFFDRVAGHVSTALSDGRSYADTQARATALAELDRTKTAYFSSVSHELRTPLTLVLGPLDELLARASAEDRPRLELVHRNALRLHALVDALLDVARIESGRVRGSFEELDLAALTSEPAVDARSPARPAAATERRARILFVDDNADMRAYASDVLAAWDVALAANGEDALADIRREPPDLVITDVMMPVLDGIGLLRALRQDPALRCLPVILLSARTGEASRVAGIEAGADDYLEKPFSARELRARVRATIELARARLDAGRAIEANRAKDEFLAMLGHELRNPLAPIATSLQVIRLTGQATPELVEIIDNQIAQMSRLVDDLLDVARIARGKLALRREHVELSHVIARAREIAEPRAAPSQVEIAVAVPEGIWLDADPQRLAQVFSNLFANAVEHSPPGSRVEIAAERDGDLARVRVSDRGSGIEPGLVPHVFEPFVQADAGEQPRAGLGLGLAIARKLVELHAGAIAVTDNTADGCTFTVELPAIETPASRASPAREAAASHRAARVLLVDNNRDGAKALRIGLELLGHRVEVAHDAETALTLAGAFAPEVALLDIKLPGVDGYELARRLRARGPMVLVAVTGYGADADRARSAEAGFAHHLVKPFELETVHRAIVAGIERA